MAKSYPVKVFYFRNLKGEKRWFADRWEAWNEAYKMMAGRPRGTVTDIYMITIPRSVNAKIVHALLTHTKLSQFQEIKVDWVTGHTVPPRANTTPNTVDPWDLLGLDRSKQTITREAVTAAFRAAAFKFHPDQGGTTEAMQKVNAAHDAIKRQYGWI